MKILGHNFLRSNFTRVSPLHWFGRHLQENRVANVLKDIQGLGVRILKPTDTDGRGWLIVNDGGSDVPLPPEFPVPGGSTDDQFRVSISGTNYVKIKGGVWQVTRKSWNSSASRYEPRTEVYSPSSSGTVSWLIAILTDGTAYSGASSGDVAVSAESEIWAELYLDNPTATDRLKLHVLATPVTMTTRWAEDKYWQKIATVKIGDSGGISYIQQHHQGGIDTDITADDGDTPTTVDNIDSETAVTTDKQWRSHTTGAAAPLRIMRSRMYLDASEYKIILFEWYEWYSTDGMLLAVGPETEKDTLDLDPVEVDVLTNAGLTITGTSDDHTHSFKFKRKTVKVLEASDESSWIDATF